MSITKRSIQVLTVIVMAIMMSFLAGCGSSGSSSSDDSGTPGDIVPRNDFAGIWLIQKEDTSSLWIFHEDGTFEKKRAGRPLNSPNHFSGTYSITEGFLTGSFTNPGVGPGDIEGTITEDDVFLMNFIEYWHTPAKVVPCVGVRQ